MDEEGDATHPPNLMDDIEQGSEGPASNDEGVLGFPRDEDDEMMDLDEVPGGGMPDLESYATTKVTQVGIRLVHPGVSMLTGVYRIVRGVP